MAHDVFITHSSKDRKTADAVHRALEQAGIACWYAPADIRGGTSWTSSIMEGIANCRVMILVWSKNSNESRHVTREVHLAFKRDLIVIPFRIDDVAPTRDLEYYLESVQSLDAFTPPLEDNLARLVEHVQTFLPADRSSSEVHDQNQGQQNSEAIGRAADEAEGIGRRQRAEEERQLFEAQRKQAAEQEQRRLEAEERERLRLEAERKEAQEEKRRRVEAEATRKDAEERERLRLEAERKKAQEEERQRVAADVERKRAEAQENLRREVEKKAQEERRRVETERKAKEEDERRRTAPPPVLQNDGAPDSNLSASTSVEVPALKESLASPSEADPSTPALSFTGSSVSTWRALTSKIGTQGVAILIVGAVALILLSAWLLFWRSPAPVAQESVAQSAPATPLPDGQQSNSSSPAATPIKKSFSGEFTVGKALELIFGTYDYQKKAVTWKVTKADISNSGIPARDVPQFLGTVYTAALFDKSFSQDGIQRRFLITYTTPGSSFDCFGCAPIIGGAAFSQQGDAWQLDSESRLISRIGSYGSPPADEAKLIQIGPHRSALLFELSNSHMGSSDTGIVIIGEGQENFQVLFGFPDYSGENGASGCTETPGTCFDYSSKMTFEAGANSDYYDIKIVTTGSKPDKKGKARPINQVRKLTFKDNKYVLVR
jgi:hypothetical protein